MIRKITSLSHKTLLIILVAAVAVAAGIYIKDHRSKPVPVAGLAEYLNFGNSYVYKVPKNYSVDAQSVLGAELIYSGPITAKTVQDIYDRGGIGTQALDIKDHSSSGFKGYVNGSFLSDLKKNLSTNDVKVKFGKANGSDNAQITVKKDGQQVRFIYLKNGQHPASVIAKTETDVFKVIEQTITDLESSDLKNESDALKQSLQSNIQLVKAQKAPELYSAASPELRSQTSEDQLSTVLKSASSFLNQNITVSGGSYSQASFSAALRFTPPNQDNPQPTLGAITLKKAEGQWKLQGLSLPTPKQ